MSNETNVANASIVSLTGGGIVGIVNEYQVIISVSIAFLGLAMGLVFHVIDRVHKNRIEKRETEEYKRKLRQEIIEELFKEEESKIVNLNTKAECLSFPTTKVMPCGHYDIGCTDNMCNDG